MLICICERDHRKNSRRTSNRVFAGAIREGRCPLDWRAGEQTKSLGRNTLPRANNRFFLLQNTIHLDGVYFIFVCLECHSNIALSGLSEAKGNRVGPWEQTL